MIVLSTTAAVLTGMVLAAWLGAAVWATADAVKRRRRGERAAEAARTGGALLESAPTAFMIVDGKDRIRSGPKLADWLGLDEPPGELDDLGKTLAEEYRKPLVEAIRATRRTARPFGIELRIEGSPRILFAQGSPVPAGLGDDNGALVWFFDASEMRSEIATLQSQVTRTTEALNALSAIVEAAPLPMWHRGPDLRLTLVNQAYVKAVEAENAAEAVARGLELVDLTGPESPQAIAAQVRETAKPHSRTLPVTLAGERRTVRIVDVPLGETGVAGYAVDIEALEQARGELERFGRAQRDMLDLLSAGVAQFGADHSLSFTNRPFQRMFAMKNEWLAERPEFDRVLDRMREAERLPASRNFPEWRAERRQWFQSGNEAIEENWLLPDGTHLRLVAQPLPDGGLLLIFEDRTEQAQLASARDTLLQVRTATFDNLFEATGVFAADGRLHLWNRRFREIWELEEQALATHPRVDALADMVAAHFDDPERAGEISKAVRVATNQRRQQAGRFALKDGRHFRYAAVPLPDGNALFTILDISDTQRIEGALRDRNEALEAADRLKTSFVSNMSYELRTPLTSIAGFAEMLDGGYAGKLPEKATEYVSSILESVGKLRTQIDDVLDLTQSEAGGLAMAQEEVDLGRLCQEAGEDAKAAAAARGHELVEDIDWSVGSVTGDGLRLRQAVDHLLRNAIRYTPANGRIFLHGEGDAREARITVSDNGPGIAEDEQRKVFDRFHRIDGEDRSRALGLGLPLTRQFVEAHGGTIALHSAPGEGTFVTISLPRETG